MHASWCSWMDCTQVYGHKSVHRNQVLVLICGLCIPGQNPQLHRTGTSTARVVSHRQAPQLCVCVCTCLKTLKQTPFGNCQHTTPSTATALTWSSRSTTLKFNVLLTALDCSPSHTSLGAIPKIHRRPQPSLLSLHWPERPRS